MVDHKEIARKSEHGHDDDGRRRTHLFPGGPGDTLHLEVQFFKIVLHASRPTAGSLRDAHFFVHISLESGRGGGIRTPTRGFGDRWSAVKPTPLIGGQGSMASGRSSPVYHFQLFDLLVRNMFAAERTELLELYALRHGLFILRAGVVLPLAFGALQCNLFAWHKLPIPIFPLPFRPRPCVRPRGSQSAGLCPWPPA